MKTNYIITGLVLLVILAGCETELPDPIVGDIDEIVNYPADLVDQTTTIANISAAGQSMATVINSANNSSLASANQFGTELDEFKSLLDAINFISRIPPNAVISQEAIPGTNATGEVLVYQYSLYTLRDGSAVTTYVSYQIEQGDNQFIHTLFSGAAANPTSQNVRAIIPISGDSANFSLNFGSAVELMSTTSGNEDIFVLTEGTTKKTLSFIGNDALKIVKSVGGTITSDKQWNSTINYGVFDGAFDLEGYDGLNIWDDLTTISTLKGKSGVAAIENSIDDRLNNHLLDLRPYFALPANPVISSDEVKGVSALSMIYDKGDTTYTYNYAVGDEIIYHEIKWADSVVFFAEESIDGSMTDIFNYTQPSNDPENDHYLRFRRTVIDNSVKLVVSEPQAWNNQTLVNYYGVFEYAPDLSGSWHHYAAATANYEAGTLWFSNSYWSICKWTANGATGEYHSKDVRFFGDGRYNGTEVQADRPYTVSGTW